MNIKNIDPELIEEAKKIKRISDFKNFLKTHNINFSEEETSRAFNFTSSGKQKMNLDELESVSGGKGNTEKITKVKQGEIINKSDSENQDEYNMRD